MKSARTKSTKTKSKSRTKADGTTQPAKLLSGGNPQIAKGDGDAPVQAYINAMPGWKRDLGQRVDALIVRAVPNVRPCQFNIRYNVFTSNPVISGGV